MVIAIGTGTVPLGACQLPGASSGDARTVYTIVSGTSSGGNAAAYMGNHPNSYHYTCPNGGECYTYSGGFNFTIETVAATADLVGASSHPVGYPDTLRLAVSPDTVAELPTPVNEAEWIWYPEGGSPVELSGCLRTCVLNGAASMVSGTVEVNYRVNGRTGFKSMGIIAVPSSHNVRIDKPVIQYGDSATATVVIVGNGLIVGWRYDRDGGGADYTQCGTSSTCTHKPQVSGKIVPIVRLDNGSPQDNENARVTVNGCPPASRARLSLEQSRCTQGYGLLCRTFKLRCTRIWAYGECGSMLFGHHS